MSIFRPFLASLDLYIEVLPVFIKTITNLCHWIFKKKKGYTECKTFILFATLMLSLSPMLSHLCTVLYMWALRNCLDTVGYICFLAGSKKGAKEKQKQNVNYRTIIRELKFSKLNSAQTEFLFDSKQSSHAQPSSEWKYSTENALTFYDFKNL